MDMVVQRSFLSTFNIQLIMKSKQALLLPIFLIALISLSLAIAPAWVLPLFWTTTLAKPLSLFPLLFILSQSSYYIKVSF